MKTFVKILATFFGVGHLPWMPGTWASMAGIALACFFPNTLLWQAIVFSLIGLSICAPAEQAFQKKDPGAFVLDEVAGMAISLLWLPQNWTVFALAFFLFRLFDTWKPGPIGKIQASKNPMSIMWDDILAGLFVNIILQIAVRLFPFLTA